MKSNPITTTPKQSLKLIELGFTPASADFMWVKDNIIKTQLILRSMERNFPGGWYKKIPAWSLSSLINFLPDGITIPDENEKDEDFAFEIGAFYHLQIEKSENEGYTVAYRVGDDTLFTTVKDNLVSAIVKTLEWVIKDHGWTAQVLMENVEDKE